MVGATEPLTTALLAKKVSDKEQIIAINAGFMLLTHFAKSADLGWWVFIICTTGVFFWY